MSLSFFDCGRLRFSDCTCHYEDDGTGVLYLVDPGNEFRQGQIQKAREKLATKLRSIAGELGGCMYTDRHDSNPQIRALHEIAAFLVHHR